MAAVIDGLARNGLMLSRSKWIAKSTYLEQIMGLPAPSGELAIPLERFRKPSGELAIPLERFGKPNGELAIPLERFGK